MKHFNFQDKLTAKYCMALVLAIFCMLAAYRLIIAADFEQYKTLSGQKKSLKLQFEHKQKQAANIAAYRNQIKILQQAFDKDFKQLSGSNEMPDLLENISRTGKACGLIFELFIPMTDLMHDFYSEKSISLTVSGKYPQLVEFLNRIAVMNPIVTLHDFEIHNKNTGDLLEMKIIAKLYKTS